MGADNTAILASRMCAFKKRTRGTGFWRNVTNVSITWRSWPRETLRHVSRIFIATNMKTN